MPQLPAAARWSLASELGAWRAAFGTLKDNPLAGYWQLALKRRTLKIGWMRRSLPTLVTVVAMLLIYLIVVGSNPPGKLNEWLLSLYLIVGLPAYVVWLATGVHQMARDAAYLLSRGGRKLAAPQFDELLAVSALSAQELLLGTLRVVLPALIWRVLLGALLVWFGMLALVTEGFNDSSQELYHVIIFGPLTVAGVFAGSLLACICLALLAIILGHRTQHPAAIPGLAGLAAFWTLFSLMFNIGLFGAMFFDSSTQILNLAPALEAAVIFLGICWMALVLALRSRLAPALVIIGMPLLLVVCIVASLILNAGNDLFWFTGDAEDLLMNGCWILGSLAPLNLHCIPSPLCWGDQELGHALSNLPRLALFYAVQLVLLLLLAHHARLHLTQQRGEMS